VRERYFKGTLFIGEAEGHREPKTCKHERTAI
jgi:hypothetical protein